MTGWSRHALALGLLALLNLGLYGRLYSPLDHAYPEGEAASASITRFIAESPHPWGWNPSSGGGQPTQDTALPAFHYAAAGLSWLGNEPLYAHRLVAVTMTLAAPLALYLLMTAFGIAWPGALAGGVVLSLFSPLYRYEESALSFLPGRLEFLERTGEAPFIAGLTLMLLVIPLVWRAALKRSAISLFAAAIGTAGIFLTDARAASSFLVGVGALELTMLGIAGEYCYRHRRVFYAVGWAYVLSCFWIAGKTLSLPITWTLVLGAVALRLLFLGRREPLLCFSVLGGWAFASLKAWNEFEIFLLLGLCVGSWRAWQDPRPLVRCFPALAFLVLLLRFDVSQWPSFRPISPAKWKQQFSAWQGDWGMRPPSASAEFQISRWFVEHPPAGRILTNGALSRRLNAWVPYAQSPWPEYQTRSRRSPDAGLVALGGEYVVDSVAGARLPVAAQIGGATIYRLPFRSLAMSVDGGVDRSPLELRWLSSRRMQLTGTLPKGHLLDIKVNYHEGWQATQGGRDVPITRGANGFLSLSPDAGSVDLQVEFNGTREQRRFAYISGFAWLASLVYVVIRSRRG